MFNLKSFRCAIKIHLNFKLFKNNNFFQNFKNILNKFSR